GQIAISLVLLVTGGLFVKSLERARQLDLGFRPDHLLLADAQPGLNGYDPAERRAFYRRVRDRVAALPQARLVAWASTAPFASDISDTNMFVEGRPPSPTGAAPMAFVVR